jgi:dienelactone hydrolase
MINRKFSRRQFLQGAAGIAAIGTLGAFPASRAWAAPATRIGLLSTTIDGYLAVPQYASNHHSIIVLADTANEAVARDIADRLARQGFTALVPAVSGDLEAGLAAIRKAAEQMPAGWQKLHIVGIGSMGNLAVSAANRMADVGRVVVVKAARTTARFAFEKPTHDALFLQFQPTNSTTIEKTLQQATRWLTSTRKDI